MAQKSGFKSWVANFIDGTARIFDFTGSMNRRRYRGSSFSAAAALRSDWIAVGNDLHAAMSRFEAQEAGPLHPNSELTGRGNPSPALEPDNQPYLDPPAWVNPLPSPIDLRGYEDALPGAAARILALAESEASHRQEMEFRESLAPLTGLIAGTVVAIAALVAGAFLILTGNELAGALIIGIDLVGLASVFAFGSRTHQRSTVS